MGRICNSNFEQVPSFVPILPFITGPFSPNPLSTLSSQSSPCLIFDNTTQFSYLSVERSHSARTMHWRDWLLPPVNRRASHNQGIRAGLTGSPERPQGQGALLSIPLWRAAGPRRGRLKGGSYAMSRASRHYWWVRRSGSKRSMLIST